MNNPQPYSPLTEDDLSSCSSSSTSYEFFSLDECNDSSSSYDCSSVLECVTNLVKIT
jgi:hypothetical protein